MRHIHTKYPDYINEVSKVIGSLRSKSNKEIKKKVKYFQRDGKEEELDVMGVKGELIFSHYLHSIGVEHKLNTLLNDKPVSEPDIIIGDKTIDVKCTRSTSPYFLVNERAHLKDKNIGFYAFVMPFKNNTADIYICSYDSVNKWGVKNFKYTSAYYKLIS
jgi:hypothetical protein